MDLNKNFSDNGDSDYQPQNFHLLHDHFDKCIRVRFDNITTPPETL